MNLPAKFTITSPDDCHVHFRSGAVLRVVVPETVKHFRRALVMPNVPAIETASRVNWYRDQIFGAVEHYPFEPLMTIKLTHRTTPQTIEGACAAGAVAAKLYPEGATTASHDGIKDPWTRELQAVYQAMSDCKMVLCIHAENPESPVLARESEYLVVVNMIIQRYRDLKVVIEHITTEEAVRFVMVGPQNLAATITAHHLLHTLDDVIGHGIKPHHFCYPVPKRDLDRATLRNAAFGVCNRFFFGSDSAPHVRSAKESACGCAGVFSAPVALAVLAERCLSRPDMMSFDMAIARLQAFTSERGADFYGLPRNTGTITLEHEPWTVADCYDNIVPFLAGQTLEWQVTDRKD